MEHLSPPLSPEKREETPTRYGGAAKTFMLLYPTAAVHLTSQVTAYIINNHLATTDLKIKYSEVFQPEEVISIYHHRQQKNQYLTLTHMFLLCPMKKGIFYSRLGVSLCPKEWCSVIFVSQPKGLV